MDSARDLIVSLREYLRQLSSRQIQEDSSSALSKEDAQEKKRGSTKENKDFFTLLFHQENGEVNSQCDIQERAVFEVRAVVHSDLDSSMSLSSEPNIFVNVITSEVESEQKCLSFIVHTSSEDAIQRLDAIELDFKIIWNYQENLTLRSALD
ncbi:hypothetical protein ACTXT7_006744 [Hymenolepis weldensis]